MPRRGRLDTPHNPDEIQAINRAEDAESDWAETQRAGSFLEDLKIEIERDHGAGIEGIINYFRMVKPERQREIDEMAGKYVQSGDNQELLKFAQRLLELPNKYRNEKEY